MLPSSLVCWPNSVPCGCRPEVPRWFPSWLSSFSCTCIPHVPCHLRASNTSMWKPILLTLGISLTSSFVTSWRELSVFKRLLRLNQAHPDHFPLAIQLITEVTQGVKVILKLLQPSPLICAKAPESPAKRKMLKYSSEVKHLRHMSTFLSNLP